MIYIIAGQTASGKTSLALKFASLIGGEIINGDAFQVYRGLDIGTAKPSLEERKTTSHHLFDIVDIDHKFSIFEYQKMARAKINELIDKNIPVIIVGGSGLYIRSVLFDYKFIETKTVDMGAYEKLTNEDLHRELKKIDEESAAKIHPNNRRRVMRAIEIFLQNGISKSELEKAQRKEPLYPYVMVALERPVDVLENNIRLRVHDMFKAGLKEEINYLLKTYPPNSPGFAAIGYRELIDNAHLNDERLIALISLNTRQYAKRQRTFFYNQFKITTFNNDEEALSFLLTTYQGGLKHASN